MFALPLKAQTKLEVQRKKEEGERPSQKRQKQKERIMKQTRRLE
jgi:hypothetical protein